MVTSGVARRSVWPLAGYALLALLALTRRAPVRSRHLYLRRANVAAFDLTSGRTEKLSQSGASRSGSSGWWAVIRDAGAQWVSHKDARLGAALAYYSVFSIGPLIIIAIAIAGLLFGQDAVRGEVSNSLRGLVGDTGAQAIDAMLASASKPSEGMIAAAIGIGTLVLAAIGVVVQLKDALNTVWEVETPPGRGIWGFVRAYVLSFAGVISLGFLLLVSMLVTTALAAGGKYLAPDLPEALLQAVNFVVSLGTISLLFAMMFKWLPDAKVTWRDVWPGALATAILFEAGKFLIGLYIGKQGLESTYGAAASIVVVLIWVYFSAQIVLLGAEFTNVYAKQRGSLSSPRPGAAKG